MQLDPKLTREYLLRAAEAFVEQTENFESMSMKGLAEFLGIGVHILYNRFPLPQWKQLQHTWIRNRLSKAIEDFRAEGKTQEDITVERIANHTQIPPRIIQPMLLEDEWRDQLATFSKICEEIVSPEYSSMSAQYVLKAERYLASTEQYEAVTLKRFAEFLVEPEHIVRKRLPFYQWEQLRHNWIEERLKRAIDDAYNNARTQSDFTLESIVRHAAMPSIIVYRFLPAHNFQNRRATLPTKKSETSTRNVLEVETYFAQVERYEDITMQHFAKYLGVSSHTAGESLPDGLWETLRNKWIEKRLREAIDAAYAEATTRDDFGFKGIARRAGIPVSAAHSHFLFEEWRTRNETLPPKYDDPLNQLRQAMDTISAEAKTREDFTLTRIGGLVDIPYNVANYYIGKEWELRRATLPTTKEKVLAALQTLVDANTPVSEMTRQHVIELADVNGSGMWKWFSQPYADALRQVALHSYTQPVDSVRAISARVIPGGWIDIDAST